MIPRRSFLKYISSLPVLIAMPAAIIGNRLGVASKVKVATSTVTQTARVCTAEIDDQRSIPDGRGRIAKRRIGEQK